jgi:hypothetical protein
VGRVGADETLLIATIFLRLYEQMNSSVYGVDFKQHLFGSAAIVNAQAHRELVQASGVTGNFLSTLHEASFWSFLRQDIDMALANQKQPKVELSLCRITWDSDASDTTWAKWMIWIVAETAALCFGGETNDVEGASALGRVVLRERWAEMKEKCARWWWSKPNGFLPLYYQKRDVAAGRWFPEIWLGSPWHSKKTTRLNLHFTALKLIRISVDSHRDTVLPRGHGPPGHLRPLQVETWARLYARSPRVTAGGVASCPRDGGSLLWETSRRPGPFDSDTRHCGMRIVVRGTDGAGLAIGSASRAPDHEWMAYG